MAVIEPVDAIEIVKSIGVVIFEGVTEIDVTVSNCFY